MILLNTLPFMDPLPLSLSLALAIKINQASVEGQLDIFACLAENINLPKLFLVHRVSFLFGPHAIEQSIDRVSQLHHQRPSSHHRRPHPTNALGAERREESREGEEHSNVPPRAAIINLWLGIELHAKDRHRRRRWRRRSDEL